MPTELLITEIPYSDPLLYFQPFCNEPGAVLLHSAKKMEHLGRYSYFAIDPFAEIKAEQGAKLNPLDQIDQFIQPFQITPVEGLPPFQGGAVGYLSYELLQHLEKVDAAKQDDMQFPLAHLAFYDLVVGFDHEKKQAWIFASGFPESDPVEQNKRTVNRTDWLLEKLKKLSENISYGNGKLKTTDIQANFSCDKYLNTVQKTVNYIFDGDIFEANIAQRFETELPNNLTPWHLFARSCKINAATFASFLNFDDVILASASPERFIQCNNKKVECRPIKGTRPRGKNPDEDLRLANELSNSEKDRAENIMIVDLMRNDIARVCEDASVNVTQLCGLESYATVHHLVSVVEGKLQNDKTAVDLLKATFPPGSITGAPKIRAMEVIAELEPHHRGPYCGTIFCLGFDGFLDSSVTIRTFAIKNKSQVTFHAGGAIVSDSDPESEYQESLDKATALKKVLTESFS